MAMQGWARVAARIRVPLGFVFAAVFLWVARPVAKSLVYSLALVLPGLALRAYASGYVRKNRELTETGPYAYTRNPLYLGSMMIAFGFAAASRSWWITGLLAALFMAVYVPVIRGEEARLRELFPAFDAYAKRVPRLLPRLTGGLAVGRDAGGGFSLQLYLKHREYNALAGALAIYASLLLKMWLMR